MAMPPGATQAVQTVAANAGWLKFGQSSIGIAVIFWILSWITGSEALDSIAVFTCCMSLIAFMVAGIIAGAATGTAAVAGTAGVGGVAMSNAQSRAQDMGISREQQEHARLVAQRARALQGEGIDAELLFGQVANWMASTGTTPGMLFRRLDKDGNGYLDHFEIREGFAEMKIADLPPWLMGSVIALVDADDSDNIDYDEWLALFARLGWQASEPSVSVDNENPVAGSTVQVTFSAPPWASERKSWVGLVPSDAPHGSLKVLEEYEIDYQYLDGNTEGEMEFIVSEGGFWDIRMYDSEFVDSGMEVASVSLVVAEAPMGDISHYRDSETETDQAEPTTTDVSLAETTSVEEDGQSGGEEGETEDGESDHPLKEIIETLPQENQAKAWETAETIEDMILEADDDVEKAGAQAILTTFVDDVVHGLSTEKWASLAALSALAGAGVVAMKQGQGDESGLDFEPSTISEVAELEEVAAEQDEASEVEPTPEQEPEQEPEPTVAEFADTELNQLVEQLSSARFMSEREAVLAEWNNPLNLSLSVERTERTLGLGLPDTHRGGMSVLSHTESGVELIIRLPAEANDAVAELKDGSNIITAAVPAAWVSGQNRVALDADTFDREHL
ncbi:MAG TPA: hypothetical protein EYN46_02100 [Candidatus Poseidoniales archaeon]|nr:hypothetical protein [Candidatus Poseidoniales archaeon]